MNTVVYAGNYGCKSDYKNKYFEIILPDCGGKIFADEAELTFNSGDLIAIPPYSGYYFSDNILGLHVLLERAFIPLKNAEVFSDDANGGVRHAAKQAAEYFESSLPKKQNVLTALGSLLAAYVSAFCVKEEFSPAVALVRADIEKNISNAGYALDGFIKKLPLNYDYVRKLFKKEVGATPHEYLLSQRMELAAKILSGGIKNKYSNYSVSQAAEACGFAEPLYFSRVFKKYYGVSPSEYKE